MGLDRIERTLVEVCDAPDSRLSQVPSSPKDPDILSLLPPHQQKHLISMAKLMALRVTHCKWVSPLTLF